MTKNFVIDEETLKTVINYLATKPYAEVAAGIQKLQTLQTVELEPEEKTNG